jgi:predicted AlkP superfamily phosphohydrolase/phosphomutase
VVGRLVVIALSEASPLLIESFCEAGKMPRLKGLKERGVTGRTRYGAPSLLTPQMWATVLTGRTAGSHGIFDYWQRSADGGFREMHGGDIRGPRLVDELHRRGIPAGFVNLPMTFPPPEGYGFTISGQDAPGAHSSMAYPRELYRALTAKFGRYHHKDTFPGFEPKTKYANTVTNEVYRQAELFRWIGENTDWKFLALYSSGTAFAQHYFWSDMADVQSPLKFTVENTYRAADYLIGQVVDLLDEDDQLVVMSECGAGPITGGVRLNSWLEAQGFLARFRATPSRWARLLNGLRSTVPRYLPKSAFRFINRRTLKSFVQASIARDGIDWSRTSAFHRGKGEGNIYINGRGDRGGIVADEDYDAVRDSIAAGLRELCDPSTGKRAVRAVHRREDIYSGDHVSEAPDLIVEWADFAYMPCEGIDVETEVFAPRTREYMTWPTSGSHRREGFFLAHGKGIRSGSLPAPIDLADLAPTWLEMLGEAQPQTMEGRSRFAEITEV